MVTDGAASPIISDTSTMDSPAVKGAAQRRVPFGVEATLRHAGPDQDGVPTLPHVAVRQWTARARREDQAGVLPLGTRYLPLIPLQPLPSAECLRGLALVSALRGAGRRPVEHPEDVLLVAVADALGSMAGGAGVTCAPARDVAMREAALGFASPGVAYWVPVRWPPGSGATAAPGC